MAVRRLARQGLQWAAEQAQPVASTSQLAATTTRTSTSCPGCRRGLAHAVQLSPEGASALDKSTSADHQGSGHSDHHQQRQQQQQQQQQGRRGWTSLLFPSSSPSTPSPAPNEAPVSSRKLTGAAADLVLELKRRHPDPTRTWDLFTQLDFDGRTVSLPRYFLAQILPALYTRPPPNRSVQNVTAAARAYQTKVDLVRLRLRQAGVAPSRSEHAALVRQFHALRYAPGLVRAWDAYLAAGFVPSPDECHKAFEALAGWAELHGRAAGRAVERAAAKPLAAKAAEMLFLDIGSGATTTMSARRCVDVSLEPFFRLVIKAGDHALFARAFKKLYGFDVALPGALLDASSAERAQLRTLGESEVCWVLEALADKDDIPGMIAAFETFDQPARPPPSSDFFTPSPSRDEGDRQPQAPHTSEADAHLVGTRAFTILIQAASRLGNAHVARHYFDLLLMRWSGDADRRLREVEEAVGIVEAQDEWVDDVAPSTSASPADASSSIDAVDAAAAPSPLDAAAPSEAASPASVEPAPAKADVSSPSSTAPAPSWTSSIPHSVSLVTRYGAHLTPAPSAPSKPYVVPSALIAHVAHRAKTQYDSSTAWWLRRRTKRILQLMERHMARIQGVLAALDVAPEPEASQEGAEEAVPQSVAELRRELALVAYHLDQLRLTLSSVKADERIVSAWKVLHARQSTLSLRRQRVADPALGRREQREAMSGLRRKQWQVLHARMLLVRHRIQKLRDVDGARTGNPEHDMWVARYRELKAKAFPPEEAPVDASAGAQQVQAQVRGLAGARRMDVV